VKKILIIEDDQNLGPGILKFLKDESFDATLVTSILKTNEAIKSIKFDLIVLDWMLADGQGIDLLRELRMKKNQVPIIMLTARTDLIDKIVGLETGANDYLTKPFEPRELLARIRVQLRDKTESLVIQNKIVHYDVEIDLMKREVRYKGQVIVLTKMEFELLRLLTEYPGKSFSRDELLNKVWGFENYPTTRTVDTHILQLRQKISDDYIETIWGFGYKVRE
jgi:DNA-binding response OmpR family regulator